MSFGSSTTSRRSTPPRGTRSSRHSRRPRRSCATNTCLRCTASGSATEETGWLPQFLALFEADHLVAACPLYLKTHSYGEYVFDWAWADAYERHGLRYYPKLLDAVPFTPVPGPRLLAASATHRAVLLRGDAAARPRRQAVVGPPAVHRRSRPRRGRAGRLDAAQHGAVPLAQPRACALRRLRRLPRAPAAREAQEDPAGAAPRRRGRHPLRDPRGRRDQPQPTGTSSTAATR